MKRAALILLALASAAMAQVTYTGAAYSENFNSMGTTGTAPPAGWSFHGTLGGSSATWTDATGIAASGIGGGTLNNTLTAATTFTTSSNTAGFNYALPASTADRAIGTAPTSGQGVVWQLALTNGTGAPISTVRLSYDIRRFTAPATANELPGYWLFASTDSGATWANISPLNPALTGALVTVPNSTGVTTVSNVAFTLPAPWSAGGSLLLRWVDDNATQTSPDQIIGLDNVTVDQPIGQPPTVALTSPADGAVFTVGDTIPLAASASDSDGVVTKVEFYQGNTKLGEDLAAPFQFAWSDFASGSYNLTARATDDDGNITLSSARALTVNATAGSGTLTRGAYLQMAAPHRMTIRWRSSQAIVGRVRFGLSAANLDQTSDEAGGTTDHIVALTGLTPATTYYYSIGSATDTLASGTDHTFTTPPNIGTAVNTRVWVLGDAGTATANQTAVRNAFYTWTGAQTPSLVLQLGDNAYNTGTDTEFQGAVFNIYTTLLRRTPFWSCLGNHETGQSTAFVDTYPYFNIYTFPTAGECGGVPSGTEHYYSFDYGNIHFISLDSMTADRSPTGAMAMWLQSDLASTTATWIVCYFHHPPYTKGSHNSDSSSDSAGSMVQMRENLLPILETGGVDLVLSGHSHSYERSYLLDGHYGLSGTLTSAMKKDAGDGRPAGDGAYIKPLTGPRDHFGAVYSVPGSAGQISGGTLNHPGHFISLNNLGSLVLDVNGTTLTGTFLRENGTTPDTFTIVKQGAADSDGDGVADAFEIAHGMNRFDPSDAVLDLDKDGKTALEEYLLGLNPGVSDRYIWTTTRDPLTSFASVTFPTLPQRTYEVLWSDDLLAWQSGSAVVAGDGSTMMWIDDGTVTGSLPGSGLRRFYRVRVRNGP